MLALTKNIVFEEARCMGKLQMQWLEKQLARQYGKALVSAGEAVGSVSAMSMSEPVTQLTLNTFHSTGKTVGQVVTGLKAMNELTNADDKKEKHMHMAQTSTATIRFKEPFSRSATYAKAVAQGLQRVSLRAVILNSRAVREPVGRGTSMLSMLEANGRFAPEAEHIKKDRRRKALSVGLESYKNVVRQYQKQVEEERGVRSDEPLENQLSEWRIEFYLRQDVLDDFGLSVSHVSQALRNYLRADALVTSTGITSEVWVVSVRMRGLAALAVASNIFDATQAAMAERRISEMTRVHLVEHVLVHGHPIISSAIAKERPRFLMDGTVTKEHVVETVGGDMRSLCALPGVDSSRTIVNSVIAIQRVLGVEAASALMSRRFREIFGDARVDNRHIDHLVRVMTHAGAITPLTRDRMRNLGSKVLGRAAFEMTTSVLQKAASASAVDPLNCVPSSVIIGRLSRQLGTGLVRCYTDPAYKLVMAQARAEGMMVEG